MKHFHAQFLVALSFTIALAACVPAPEVTPPPTPAPAPASSAPPPPAPSVPANWIDAPQSAGDWSYTSGPLGSTASFRAPGGSELLALRCERPQSRIVVIRSAAGDNPAPQITIRTETTDRAVGADVSGGVVQASLAASDRLLDAMALSKGRFAVEVHGAPTLYLPSWAEVTRVIEDCR